MRKTAVFPILTIISFLLVASVAAQSVRPTKEAQITQRAEKQADRQAAITAKCTQRTAKIGEKINRFNANADHPRLLKIQERLTQLISTLQAKNIDTTKLASDLATLKTKSDGCKNAYGLFIAKLQATKNFTCGQSDGQFAAALATARTEKEKAKTACQDARNFVRNTVKGDLQAIREQLRTLKVSVTPTP